MSDSESDYSVPGKLSRDLMIEFDNGDLLYRDRDFDRNRIEQRFADINRQIGELTNIVLSLTEKISSNIRRLNVLSTESNRRSDSMRYSKISKSYLYSLLQN